MKSSFPWSTRLQQLATGASAALRRSGRLRLHLPLLTLVASLAITFVVRYCTVAQHLDMGDDIANYLSTTNTLFGHNVTGLGLLRPPLIALPLKAFTLAFGDLTGVKVLGVLLSVALGIPFFLLARRLCHVWIAVVVTLLFVLTPAYSDMLVWGYLTMFGMLFIMLTLHCLLLLLERPTILNTALTGLFASFIVGFHQLSLAFFAPLSLLLFLALLVFNRQGLLRNYRWVVAAIVIAVILSIPYVPIYLRLLHLQAPAISNTPLISLTPLTQVEADLAIQTDPAYVPWLLGIAILLAISAVATRSTWQSNRSTAIVLLVTFFYSLILILLELPPPFAELNRRAHYFMYIPIWLLGGLSLSHLWSWQTTFIRAIPRWLPKLMAIVIILALLSTSVFLSLRGLMRSLDFYGYLDDSRWSAVNWISDHTPREASIVAYPETLGWWIEAEADRQTANVADRNTVPLTYLRERSLAAERILSRNQGLDNGNLRLATTYPYGGAPGNPVLGVYVGGSYHDVMMFDDGSISLIMEGGKSANMATDSQKAFTTSGDSNSMIMTTTYQMEGATVVQTAALDRASHNAVVSYSIQSDGAKVARLHVPLFFSFEPKSISIDPDQHSIEVIQASSSLTDQVITQIDIGSSGAIVDVEPHQENRLDLSLTVQGSEAEITFTFVVTEPKLNSSVDVTYYQVPEMIKNPALEHISSIDYLAVDLKPSPHSATELPLGIEEWLSSCPYYQLVYPLDGEGDIRIYRVDTSALPLP
jgi:hypothetical protein